MNSATHLRFASLVLVLLLGLHPALSRAAGTPLAWGAPNDGRCQVPTGLTDVSIVAGGDAHSLALRANGTVVAWGFNGFGQTNVPAGLKDVMAIAAGARHSLALRSNGTVVVWGSHPAPDPALSNVTAIAAGWNHSLALKQNGTVVSWGSQSEVPPGLSNVIAIAAGDDNSLALLANNTVVGWGNNTDSKTNIPPQVTNIIAIAAGKDHCLALTRTGAVLTWGANNKGQGNVPSGLNNVSAIAAGAFHSLALKANGSLAAWGDNTFGQGSVTTAPLGFIAIGAGNYHNLGIRGDGLPVIIGQPFSQSIFVTDPVTFQVVAGGMQPLQYRWFHNGNSIQNATNASFTIPNVQSSDAGAYTVSVNNPLGSAFSAPALLTTLTSPPLITTPPRDLVAVCGDHAEFTVVGAGPKPLSYQWLYNDLPLPGATSATLVLTNINTTDAGSYSIVITNAHGAITSAPATLAIEIVPPHITSPLTALAKQGAAFTYQITAEHSPITFAIAGLPPGLTLDPLTGQISGAPQENGTFTVLLTAFNHCTSDSQVLTLSVSPSLPVITSGLAITGTEGDPVAYQITATENPTGFAANNLPPGLTLDPLTGIISGAPVYAGEFFSTISATNLWGAGSATIRFNFENIIIPNLAIANVSYNYSAPYLLDFEFTLIAPPDTNNPSVGNAVVVEPHLLSVTALEDERPISPSETAVFISRGSTKLLKAYLVLDFSQSVASLANGDADGDGLSDAVEIMVESAQAFVNQQPADAQIGVYEFHRDDMDPQQVLALTSDKKRLNEAIAGTWTNYVQDFPAASRCWDAVNAAITDLGPASRDEQHFVIFVSDGVDESSLVSVDDVITTATNNSVKVFCVGFGNELETTTLQAITTETSGRYYTANNAAELAIQFAQIGKDVKGQYILRWATLKRTSKAFMPSFKITYQQHLASSPTNPVTPGSEDVDNSVDPPVTNITEAVTNYIIGWYTPTDYSGPVTKGALRLVPDAEVLPTSISLRLAYAPRYIRQLRIQYRANWPCTVSLQSTNTGELLSGWSLTETTDDTGATWLLLSSPDPQSLATSLPFAGFGKLLTFSFKDVINPSNAFSLLKIDNDIYINTGGQSFEFENGAVFTATHPALPFGTPAPWLLQFGFSGDLAAAELADQDADGIPTWQEYRADTKPNNPASALRVQSFSKDPYDRYTVTFPTSAYRSYTVLVSTDLTNWEVVQTNIPGTGGDLTAVDKYRPGATSLYYCVQVQ